LTSDFLFAIINPAGNMRDLFGVKQFATKDDFSRLWIEILKNRQDIEKIKETMATKDDVRLILSTIDNFVKKSQDCEKGK